jgi:hypothetical protein
MQNDSVRRELLAMAADYDGLAEGVEVIDRAGQTR